MTNLGKQLFTCIVTIVVIVIIYAISFSYFKDKKKYKIEVLTAYTSGINIYTNSMDADSVKKDTIWNDGRYIINKNIVNITFK